MELAKAEMDRSSKLHEEGLISNDAYDVAVTNYNAASADYASASSKLDSASSKKAAATAQLQTAENQTESAKADLKQAEANLSYNRARLDDTVIASPIAGTVVFKSLEEGETVGPGVTILTIVDMNNLYVRTDIEETYIDTVVLDGKAIVRTGGNPGATFEGKISEIGRYAEFATQKDVTRGRQDIRTFRVKIKVDNAGGTLKPGMTVAVEIPKKAAPR
jgi:HlyD family secretion protein